MKKTSLSLGLLLALLAILFVWRFKDCNNTNITQLPSCDLPAPTSVEVNVTSPTTATVSWQGVEEANGYRVEVTDSTTNALFGTFEIPASSENFLELENLTPEHVYKASVRAKCENGQASSNFSMRIWTQGSIIIDEVVVMMRCPEIPWSGTTINLLSPSLPIIFSVPPTNQRAAFWIKATHGTNTKVIKLAIDEGCPNKLKFDRGVINSAGSSAVLVSGNTAILFTLGTGSDTRTIRFTPVYPIIPPTAGINISLSPACPGCTLEYKLCQGDTHSVNDCI